MPFFKLRFSIIFYGKLGTYFMRLLNSKNSLSKKNKSYCETQITNGMTEIVGIALLILIRSITI